MNTFRSHSSHRRRAQTTLFILCCLALLSLLSSCGFPGIAASSAQLPTVSKQQPTPALPPVSFPQDEGSHNYLTEWWYYTGHLEAIDASGTHRQYGFELVIFQVSRSNLPLLFPAHFAITDLSRNEFHYDQRSVYTPREQVPEGSVTKGINMRAADWSIQGANGHDHLQASMQNYAIDLNLSGSKPPILHNENGLITYGLGGFSYYYSRTRMAVTGTLTDHNQPLQVTGQAWMDHQWGNFLTLGGGGWDWYSLQFNDNAEMMLYFIRDASGAIISTYAGYIDANGKNTLLPATSLSFTALDHWTSPTTHITYPFGWQVAINDPQVQATLTIQPLLKNQELVANQSTGNTYWEGAVSIQGQHNGQSLRGQGYVELTGYTQS